MENKIEKGKPGFTFNMGVENIKYSQPDGETSVFTGVSVPMPKYMMIDEN